MSGYPSHKNSCLCFLVLVVIGVFQPCGLLRKCQSGRDLSRHEAATRLTLSRTSSQSELIILADGYDTSCAGAGSI